MRKVIYEATAENEGSVLFWKVVRYISYTETMEIFQEPVNYISQIVLRFDYFE